MIDASACEKALGVVREHLLDPERMVRFWALRHLRRMGSAATEAVPELLRALDDHERDVRWAAALAAGDVGAADPKLVARLAELTENDEPYVAACARYALARLGQDPERQIEALIRHTWGGMDAAAAADALGQLGAPALPAVDRLRELLTEVTTALESGVADFRLNAELGSKRIAAERAIASLERLAATGPISEKEIDERLADFASARNENDREQTQARLERLVGLGPQVIELLERRLCDGTMGADDDLAPEAVVDLLAAFGREGVSLMVRFSAQAKGTDFNFRIANLLGDLWPESQSELEKMLHSRDSDEQWAGVHGFALLGARPTTVMTLCTKLRSPDHHAHDPAVNALIWLGPSVAPEVAKYREKFIGAGRRHAADLADLVLEKLRQTG